VNDYNEDINEFESENGEEESTLISADRELMDGYSPFRDVNTNTLTMVARTWLSAHKEYMANVLRAKHGGTIIKPFLLDTAKSFYVVREEVGKKLSKLLKSHVLYPWLKEGRSTGVHIARLLTIIRDPLRFPGRACTNGHYLPTDWPEDICPVPIGKKGQKRKDAKPCRAEIGELRRGTGTRSLWHYLGVHVNEFGRSPRLQKNVQATWNIVGRTCLLQPDGIADQIIRHKKEPWYTDSFIVAKDRLKRDRGAVHESEIDDINSTMDNPTKSACVNDNQPGRMIEMDEGSGDESEIVNASGSLRAFQINNIARKIAVKAFVGDLLHEWKSMY